MSSKLVIGLLALASAVGYFYTNAKKSVKKTAPISSIGETNKKIEVESIPEVVVPAAQPVIEVPAKTPEERLEDIMSVEEAKIRADISASDAEALIEKKRKEVEADLKFEEELKAQREAQ